ncbi:hypothetical protein BDN71DRAFT_199429 [Pleurotus eryngii]|uniref:Uncharacterized protein n=1 Tax=Pleurotus eryngii TaxID=5323 RepID=A0A9P5ZMZ9_PLEER|nr:hypothetical protein BDN71DRAFT_199429 [Pleurotus eryngii]
MRKRTRAFANKGNENFNFGQCIHFVNDKSFDPFLSLLLWVNQDVVLTNLGFQIVYVKAGIPTIGMLLAHDTGPPGAGSVALMGTPNFAVLEPSAENCPQVQNESPCHPSPSKGWRNSRTAVGNGHATLIATERRHTALYTSSKRHQKRGEFSDACTHCSDAKYVPQIQLG